MRPHARPSLTAPSARAARSPLPALPVHRLCRQAVPISSYLLALAVGNLESRELVRCQAGQGARQGMRQSDRSLTAKRMLRMLPNACAPCRRALCSSTPPRGCFASALRAPSAVCGASRRWWRPVPGSLQVPSAGGACSLAAAQGACLAPTALFQRATRTAELSSACTPSLAHPSALLRCAALPAPVPAETPKFLEAAVELAGPYEVPRCARCARCAAVVLRHSPLRCGVRRRLALTVQLTRACALLLPLLRPLQWGRYDLLLLPPSFPYGGKKTDGAAAAAPGQPASRAASSRRQQRAAPLAALAPNALAMHPASRCGHTLQAWRTRASPLSPPRCSPATARWPTWWLTRLRTAGRVRVGVGGTAPRWRVRRQPRDASPATTVALSTRAYPLLPCPAGNLVTNRTWASFWLNEGFTVFLERRILGRLYGEQARC